jgi:hypothetical protein
MQAVNIPEVDVSTAQMTVHWPLCVCFVSTKAGKEKQTETRKKDMG